MSESKSAAGPAILVFGCLGLLVLSLMVAAVGMAMIVWRGVSSAAERVEIGPMDPGLPQTVSTTVAAPAPPIGDPLAVPAPTPTPIPPPMPAPVAEDPAMPMPVAADDTSLPASTRVVTARVQRVSGNVPVRRGSLCRFTVQRIDEPHGDRPYWCRAQVTCGDTLLYGGQTSGYFPCTLELPPSKHVQGVDDNTTWSDSDAAFEIDSRAGRMTVRDDSHGPHGEITVEARIVDVQ